MRANDLPELWPRQRERGPILCQLRAASDADKRIFRSATTGARRAVGAAIRRVSVAGTRLRGARGTRASRPTISWTGFTRAGNFGNPRAVHATYPAANTGHIRPDAAVGATERAGRRRLADVEPGTTAAPTTPDVAVGIDVDSPALPDCVLWIPDLGVGDQFRSELVRGFRDTRG